MVKALDMMMGRSRFSVVVELSLTVAWQSLPRVSMNHLVCPLIPTSHPLPSQYPLKACKPQQVTAHQAIKTFLELSIVAKRERHHWKGEEASLK